MIQLKGTRGRILDVAEELFADHGFDRVSIRDITKKARVNLGAINYHFGSKEDLIAAIFERRVIPVNEARLAALAAVERSGKKKRNVEHILEAFIRPTVECSFGTPQGGRAFSKLFGRCLSEPNPQIEALLERQFQPVVERLHAALTQALPRVSRWQVFWCMRFTSGALHYWLLTKDRFLPTWLGKVDVEEQIRTLISFSAAGFRAA